MIAYVLLGVVWFLIGLLCMFCFIQFVLFSQIERQTKRDALAMWIVCPFSSLHGVSLDERHEWRQNIYMLALVILWPALVPLLPLAVTRYRRENA